jgi:hypothetical protein
MGRNGGGAGGGGGGGKGQGKGKGAGPWHSGARQAPGNWGSQGHGAWAGQPYHQGGNGAGWGQPSDGWQQHAQGPWAQPPAHGAGHRSGGKGGQRYAPYGAPPQPEPDRGPGLWQGLRDATAAASVALDAAKELRSLGLGPTSTVAPGRPAEAGPGDANRGWLTAARTWLLGDAPGAAAAAPPPAPPAQPKAQPSHPPAADYTALLAKLLGSDAPSRQEPEQPNPELARLSADLLRQQQLLTLLVERVSSPTAHPPAAAPPAALPATPAAAGPPATPLAAPAGPAAQGLTVDALLNELLLQRAAAQAAPVPQQQPAAPALPLQGAAAEDGGEAGEENLPLARNPPPLAAFDPRGEVSQEGAAAFWAWLDVTPRTPWTQTGPYGEWAGKVVFRVTSAELLSWADKAAVTRAPGHQSKRDLLDTLAHACAGQAQAGASSGPSGAGAQAAKAATVLDRLRSAPPAAAS